MAARTTRKNRDDRDEVRRSSGALRARPSGTPPVLEEASTAELVRGALDEARELVALEIALARAEIEEDIARARVGAILLGLAGGSGIVAVAMLVVGLALLTGAPWIASFAFAVVFGVAAVALARRGKALVPTSLLPRTRERVSRDVAEIKELLS